MSRDLAYKAAAAALVSLASAQQLGTTPDAHPALTTWKCTTGGGCVEQATSIVIDWNWHWLRDANYNSCTTSSGLNQSLCATEAACGTNCYVEGVSNYTDQGVSTSGSSLIMTQNVLRNGVYQNSSPRVYLLAPDGQNYEGLKLLGQEISFDVDASTLVCGENGAFYLSEMDLSGGRSQYNPGGAAYGAGYCDAQCPTGTWFNGSVNTNNYGSCCNEMDLWEANANATALTPHPCNVTSVGGCTGDECGSSGDCDKNGCGFNPYALGQTSYYGAGAGFTVDTLKPVTVTTQFITDDGTTTGTLIEIRRQYIQNGVVINNAVASTGFPGLSSITESFCEADSPEGKRLGALKTMGEALSRGMVLVASVWNDAGGYMNWLDSGNSGPCSATEGNPTLINQNTPYTGATFSNIKWGDIGSTTNGKAPPPPGSSSTSATSITTSAKPPPSTSKPSTTSICTQTLCYDAINSCGRTYGGCYPACTGYPVPTFTDPGCPTVSTTTTTTTSKPIMTTSKPMTTTTKTTTTTKKTTTSSAPAPGQTHWGQCGGTGWTGVKTCQSPWKCTKQNDYYYQCL